MYEVGKLSCTYSCVGEVGFTFADRDLGQVKIYLRELKIGGRSHPQTPTRHVAYSFASAKTINEGLLDVSTAQPLQPRDNPSD